MNWLLTAACTAFAYTLFSWFGLRAGGATSALEALLAPVRDPINLALVSLGTLGFSLALYFATRASSFPVAVVISIGVVVSFAFSALVVGASVPVRAIAGVALILCGVALLR